MTTERAEAGFTLVELMVTIAIFAIVSVGFYSVMFSGTRSSTTTEDVVRVSEEARLGLNRMIRDTREGQLFANLDPTSYDVRIDFDGDGAHENPNEDGDYERLTFRYDAGSDTIRLNNEVLVAGVEPLEGTPVFSYTSSDLRYDWNGNGFTTPEELDEAGTRGYGVSADDASLYSNVHYAFRVTSGGRTTSFTGLAQLRNRR